MVNYVRNELEFNKGNVISVSNGIRAQMHSTVPINSPCESSIQMLTRYLADGSRLEGMCINGFLTGQGVKRDKNGFIQYKGEFLRDQYYGYGELFYPNGKLMYKGEFLNGLFYGEGKLYRENGSLWYTGGFVKGLFDGFGKIYDQNSSLIYVGETKQGQVHGYGECIYFDGTRYVGDCFSNGSIDGYGRKITSDGLVYEGQFSKAILNGPTKVYLPNGNYFTCNSVNNSIFGKAYLFDSNNILLEIAEFRDNIIHGNGVEFRRTPYGCQNYEYVAVNGQKTYTGVTMGESVYWNIIFSPFPRFMEDKTISATQTYNLMLDVLKYKAKTEVDIISPWLSDWTTIQNDFISALEKALERGVIVKIVTGIGKDDDDADTRRKNTIANISLLKDIFKGYEGNLYFDIRDTHEKLFLVDEDFKLSGSHNMLSYKPNEKDTRIEVMEYDTNSDLIQVNRVKRFNF